MVDSVDTRVLWSERAVGIQKDGTNEENLQTLFYFQKILSFYFSFLHFENFQKISTFFNFYTPFKTFLKLFKTFKTFSSFFELFLNFF